MPSRAKAVVFFVAVLFAAGLLSDPFPAAAAGKGLKIDLRIHGGYSRLAAADVNKGSGGMFAFYKLFADYGDYTYEGGYEPLHGGYDAGVDAIVMLSSRLGLGIGVGFLRSAGPAAATLTDSVGAVLTFSGGSVLSALPIRLGLYYALPLAGRLSVTANAGGAFYALLRFHDRFHSETGSYYATQEITANRTSLTKNLGFQGGLGLEYKVTSKWAAFVEVQGRYARFGRIGSASYYVASADGGEQTRQGTVYLRTQTLSADPPIVWNAWLVEDTPPTSDPPDLVIREPKFDLSGFCLQAGIRIRL